MAPVQSRSVSRMSRSLCAALFLLALPLALARAQSDTTTNAAFTIGPGDVMRVRIWREKDLNGDFQVDETGRLTLPLLGPRMVKGIPWVQLRDTLLALYAHELKTPSVSLTPLRRVYVLGEVTKPGLYLADPTTSLGGVIALAGGANPQGDIGRLRIVRGGRTVVDRAPIESQLQGTDVRSDDQIFIERRSWFDRNSTFLASAAISVASIVITFVRR